VTEFITGQDLVEWQLLVAAGEPLPLTQEHLGIRGHAIEARVYAEDPARDFLPQAGRLLLYREPARPGVRVDAGVMESGEVSVYYDPMVAKVIASAETRGDAIARLSAALREYPILGIRTNIPFLLRILDHPRFRAGTVDTAFLDNDGASLAEGGDGEPPAFVRAAVAAHRGAAESQFPSSESRPRATLDPWSALKEWGR